MRNSPRASASPSLPYFSSKSHLSNYLPLWLELIALDSFSCLALHDGIDAGLRAQHIRLIADVRFLLR
jgi:hypothetical protein